MYHFKMDKKKTIKIKDLYRVTFSGSRNPLFVCASSFGEAATIGNRLALHDETSTSVISVTWIDAIAKFE